MSLNVIKGKHNDLSCRVGIVVARWNSFITEKLLDGALDTLKSKGMEEKDIIVVHCPGSYEIPLAVKRLLPKVDGVIALGAVIRGETPHFDFVCEAVNRGINELNLEFDKPVAFGVLTTDNVEQAAERADADTKKGNKGAESALALLEMISILRQIEKI